MRWILILLAVFLATNVYAVDSEQLEEINQKILEYQSQIQELNLKYKETNSTLERLQLSLKTLNDKQSKLFKVIKKITSDKQMLETYLLDLQDQIQRVGEAASKRVKALYVYKRGLGQNALFKVNTVSDFSKAAIYFGILKKFDENKVYELKTLKGKRVDEGKKLAELKKKEDQSLKELESQKVEIQNRVKERSSILAVLATEKGKINQSLGGLKAQALRLETVLRSLTGGAQEERSDNAPLLNSQKTNTSVTFDGKGLKGKLNKPFDGKILYRFGKYKDSDFGNEAIPHRGVEFSGSGDVESIEVGKVVFVGTMPQFGMVVIIDHGSRDYSLYGRLEGVKVEKGALIEKGEVIGQASSPDLKGRTFYFEIRRGGNAVDPLKLVNLQ